MRMTFGRWLVWQMPGIAIKVNNINSSLLMMVDLF